MANKFYFERLVKIIARWIITWCVNGDQICKYEFSSCRYLVMHNMTCGTVPAWLPYTLNIAALFRGGFTEFMGGSGNPFWVAFHIPEDWKSHLLSYSVSHYTLILIFLNQKRVTDRNLSINQSTTWKYVPLFQISHL